MITILWLVALFALALAAATFILSRQIERRYPPSGTFATINGTRLHFIDTGEPPNPSAAPPIVFIHGASGNLHDQMMVFREKLEGKARLIFIDRPGHGWSDRGPSINDRPDGQAATIAALLDHLGIDKALISCHSFGGAIAASFALYHPERTHGVLFLSPVSHVWPGGITWYYHVAAAPVIGHFFVWTLAIPAGLRRIASGTRCVFAPNKMTEGYVERARTKLLFRPRTFRWNAIDVANLYGYVERIQTDYRRIGAPVIIITGDKDTVVLPWVHSLGLARDIRGAKLLWIENLGHKPDHVAADLACLAIENLGLRQNHDLEAAARALQKAIAGDANGPLDKCLTNDVIRDAVTGKAVPSPPVSDAGKPV